MAKQMQIKGTEEHADPEIERALAQYEDAAEEAATYKTTKDRRRDATIEGLRSGCWPPEPEGSGK